MNKRIIGSFFLVGMMCFTACQNTSDMESQQVMAGAVMEDGEPGAKLMMATSGEDQLMMDAIKAFNNLDAEAVFANSADTVRMISADGTTMMMTQEDMAGWFATMDSVNWDVMAVIPVRMDGGEAVSVIVDGMQTDYYKDGTVDSYRLMERFVFRDGKMNMVYQYKAAVTED